MTYIKFKTVYKEDTGIEADDTDCSSLVMSQVLEIENKEQLVSYHECSHF